MGSHARRCLIGLGAAAAVLGGCSHATVIKQDMVLAPNGQARIDLHQATEAIEVLNDSDTSVRVKVLDKKKQILSNMLLKAHDQARLDILPARAIHFDNEGSAQAMVRWTLRHNDHIDFTLALQP